jgi:hypothetical protein
MFDAFRIDSDNSLFRLINRNTKIEQWHKIQCPQDTTRILIDYAKSDIFLPGLQYSKFIADYPGASMLFITMPTEEWDMVLPNQNFAVTCVAFENPKAALLWKMMQ